MSNWLTAVIVIFIIAILVDGYRRRNKNRIRVSPALKKRIRNPEPEYEEEREAPTYGSELPNGGARVVAVRDPKESRLRHRKPSARELKEQRRRGEVTKRTPEQASLNLDESVPILMESVDHHQAGTHSDEQGRIEPSFAPDDSYHSKTSARHITDEGPSHHQDDENAYDEKSYDQDVEDENAFDEDDDAYDEDDYDEDADLESDYHDENEADDDYEDHDDEHDDEHDEELAEEPKAAAPQAEPEEVLIINIMAQKGEMFNGSDLLDIVLKCGLRYGSMDIFHRYSDAKGEGALLFSMANMVKPGTFDLDAMDEFSTPGVTLFMTLPIDADSMQSFDLMADTAQAIAQTLSGELKDEQRSVMTRQTLEHCRQRIRDFERKKLFRRPR